ASDSDPSCRMGTGSVRTAHRLWKPFHESRRRRRSAARYRQALCARRAGVTGGGARRRRRVRCRAPAAAGRPPPARPESAGARVLAGAVTELAGACAATASMVTAHFLAADAILLAGDDAIRERYLPAAAAGRALGAFALTEPQTGSNPLDMTTRATPDGDGVRLRGGKHFISNGGIADFIVVFAKSDPAAGARGIDAFVVDKGSPGLRAAPPEPTMGLRASPICELQIDCLVPATQRLGPPGSGFKAALRALDRGRVEVAAMALGIAAAALEATLAW